MKRKVLLLFVCLLTTIFANAQVNSVAIVGEAAGGWPGDPGNPGPTDVHQMTNTGDGIHWTYSGIVLTNATTGGGVKFRANNAWDINWGAASFPTGTGTPNGANIPTIGGTYDVTFNSATGEYAFTGGAPIPVVNLIGTATAANVLMSTTDLETYTATNVTLVDGLAQFDVDGNIFGGDTFPTGIASGPDAFIPVTAGTYSSITVNINTGDYSFVAAPVFPSIAIVGSGAGGWPSDPQIDANVLTTTDGITYTGNVALTAGEIKFRSNNNWSDPNWGGVTFPTGPDAGNPGGNIVVPTGADGYYYVTFDRPTGAYSFSIPTVAIVGSGAGGWPNDPQVDANVLSTTDGMTYTLSGITLTDGEAKFRQNNNWDVNWGAASFPSGVGTQGGSNIPTVAGTYDLSFNRMTGAFSFSPLATASFSKSSFKVYPNPSNNSWNFNGVESIEKIQIVDVLGKTVITVNPKNTTATIDASALNAGVYFAKIGTAAATQTIKLVKN